MPSSPGGSDGKKSACSVRDLGLIPGGEDLLEKEVATHSRFLLGKLHGPLRSLAGYRPWDRKELDTTKQLTLYSSKKYPSDLEKNIEYIISWKYISLY